jgi:hypothetical protein
LGCSLTVIPKNSSSNKFPELPFSAGASVTSFFYAVSSNVVEEGGFCPGLLNFFTAFSNGFLLST